MQGQEKHKLQILANKLKLRGFNDIQIPQLISMILKPTCIQNPLEPSVFICMGRNQGFYYYKSTKCNQHAIICSEKECECKINHKLCTDMYNIKAMNEKLRSKLTKTTIIERIGQLSKEIDFELLRMKDFFQTESIFYGLDEEEKKFCQNLASDTEEINQGDKNNKKITGSAVYAHLNHKEPELEEWRQHQADQFESYLYKMKQEISSQIISCIDELRLKSEKGKGLLKQSKILTTQMQVEKMGKMLQEILTKQATLILRGSDDGLTQGQFHSLCDNRPNLLYLVENSFGFKYGGFSPCKISVDRKGSWETDQSLKSFVFSLDSNKKVEVVNPEKAVSNGGQLQGEDQKQQWLVSFGDSQAPSLTIGTNSLSEQTVNGIKFFGHGIGSYETLDDPPLAVACQGTESNVFLLKEVEVFELTLPKQAEDIDEGNGNAARSFSAIQFAVYFLLLIAGICLGISFLCQQGIL